ncbi:hypothetical protein CRM22_006755 [Opisthorchis felineus]|uniref:Uncharacterized protein n=1 Tax=Opisthorchis felineus TaxID=147828 RepID=A0A4V3SE93_OPIFE|nr:hypothetical protein CRM22_006755 [Opisthorchis felineus]
MLTRGNMIDFLKPLTWCKSVWDFPRNSCRNLIETPPSTTVLCSVSCPLVHHCEGEAAQAIRQFSFLEPEEGYAEALRILDRRYGDPHIIATTSIDELTRGPTLKADDHNILISLADDMMICSATFKQLKYPNDLNSCLTIGAIVARLSSTMQTEWLNLAAKSFKFQRDPTFDELVNCISDKTDATAAQQVCAASPAKLSEVPADTNLHYIKLPS